MALGLDYEMESHHLGREVSARGRGYFVVTVEGSDDMHRCPRVFAVALLLTLAACGSPVSLAPGPRSVVAAPVRIAHTRLGAVGYRVVGSGPPLVLIMGYGWTMDDWDPRLVHALARHHRVVMFDNSGIGRTSELSEPFSIDDMADQTSALIDTLRLGRADVLGWSMGGMIAQALAVLHPAQVRRLVLCATYPGTGQAVMPPQAVTRAGSDFPANQAGAFNAFKAAISAYPSAPSVSPGTKGIQSMAVGNWLTGTDPAGRRTTRIPAGTLIADGADDQLDPVANDHALARTIHGARLVLYPDAGHAFLFQDWPRFASQADSFLAGNR
ncbi:MAG TPA: alpha/beta hydrolase [Streptosporangiaceae bacterium]|jgi:pimeloyl-ACP methyl ester carboxylesterase|nr:alpha/beta hydrolase [Streptosporangiaceae bacterium]